MKVISQSLSELFYTIDTYGTFNVGEYLTDSWFEESDIDDEQFMKDLLELHVSVINSALEHEGSPVIGVRGIDTTSPREYNFRTDQADLEIEVDLPRLLEWAHRHENALEMFLKERFTSRDGFWSFTPNNNKDFFETIDGKSEEYRDEVDQHKCIAILAGWYMTETGILTEDEYMTEMWDGFGEIAWNNFQQFTDETWEEYRKYEDEFELKSKQLPFEGFPPGFMNLMDIETWVRDVRDPNREEEDGAA